MLSSRRESERSQGAEVQVFRTIAVLAAVVYPLWGLLCDVLLPGSSNLHVQRLCVSALLLGGAGLTFAIPGLARRSRILLLICFSVLFAHYAYLVQVNQFAPFYLVGIFITLGALDVLIADAKTFILFSLGALAISLALVLPSRTPGFWGPLLLAGMATQQALFGISLAWRARLTRRLIAATLTISEKNEQLVELVHQREDLLKFVSHELRAPLTAVTGYHDLLALSLGTKATETQQEYLKGLESGAESLKRLVDELIDFARVDSANFSVVRVEGSVSELVREIASGFASFAKDKGVRLEHTIPTTPIVVPMDRGRIAQVLSNLIANAVKFTPRGGEVTVTACASEDGARVEVRDTGRGIPEEARSRIFDRFYQVSATDGTQLGGLGLGLAIARALIESHGGRIGVESRSGAGSTFWFSLPL